MKRLLIASTAALLLAGCGAESAEDNAYKIENKACGAGPPDQIARDLRIEIDTDASGGLERLAREITANYSGEAKRGAYRGCLDALTESR